MIYMKENYFSEEYCGKKKKEEIQVSSERREDKEDIRQQG